MAISSILYSSLLKLETLFSRIQYDQHFFSAGFSLTNQRLFVKLRNIVILGLMALEWIFLHPGSITVFVAIFYSIYPLEEISLVQGIQNQLIKFLQHILARIHNSFFAPCLLMSTHKVETSPFGQIYFFSERTTYEKLCNLQGRQDTLISNNEYQNHKLIQMTSTTLGWMVHRQYRLLVYSIIFRTPASAWIWKILY